MARLRVPVIATVIGEGGSGGALAIAVGDIIQMMQYAIYSVISPEGCASILWRSAEMAPEAADALGITVQPPEDARPDRQDRARAARRRAPRSAGRAAVAKRALAEALKQLQEKKPKELVETRLERLMGYGKFKEATRSAEVAAAVAARSKCGNVSRRAFRRRRFRRPAA